MPKLYWLPFWAELDPGAPRSKSDGRVYEPGGGEPIYENNKINIYFDQKLHSGKEVEIWNIDLLERSLKDS